MRVKHLSLCLLFAAAIQSYYCADITKLSAEDRRVLQDSSRFHEVHATTNLPSATVALCADDGRLAEPGQNWQATDVITDPTLPGKRLICAAVGDVYYVVHYERGGMAHTFQILVAKVEKNDVNPTMVWRDVGGWHEGYAAFVDTLRSGELDGRLEYPY